MTTALVSLLTNRPGRSEVGMTGEITLRGQVLPIGGLKEKVLAAHRAGLKKVIFPKRNEPDLEDIPDEVRDEIQFIPVETIDEVLKHALEEAAPEDSQDTVSDHAEAQAEVTTKHGHENSVENHTD